jgi:uncharacterized protein
MPLVFALLPVAGVAATDRASGLLPAIRTGDHATVSSLLAAHAADPDQLLPDGSTPLSWAVESQDPRMVRLLLDARARPDAARNAAAAPLLLACAHGNPEVLTMLLDAGADARRTATGGISPLALCAGTAPPEVVARLIAAGAAVDTADSGGQTALMWAAAKGRIDNLQVLLANGADVNRVSTGGFTPLFFALKSGNPEAPVAVLAAGGDATHVGPEATTAVQLAMYRKDFSFATRMVERGADLTARDRNGQTLLHAAAIADQPALVKLLLAKGANPGELTGVPKVEWRYEANFKTGDVVIPAKSALCLAAEAGSAGSMQYLADAGADLSLMPDGSTLVHAATGSGRVAALALALKLLPDPNITDRNGQTPLHMLLRLDEPGPETAAMLRLLADRGARTDIRNRRGQTAASLAEAAPTAIKDAYYAAFGARTAAR